RKGWPRRATPTVTVFIAIILAGSHARANQQPVISILDFGSSAIAKQATDTLRTKLRATGDLSVADPDLSRAAAKGIGYTGSLNLTVSEARDLGAALAAQFYILGDAQTLRRSSFESPVYYESYCSIFLVSARTGRLLLWERPSFENAEATYAEAKLSQYLSDDALSRRLIGIIKKSSDEERIQRTVLTASAEAVIEEAPEDEKAGEAQGIRTPRPYRRLRPEYPQSAARADAEATVDVVVDVGADGEVGEVQIVRWAGFGLDESTIATVRQLHFFPAMKNGTPIPMRVMLRYNFRKPPR
ncbi:MAG TPA: energy transducer TonB, partial [Pyrinomonadaceae bacterium]|nr:energy transducer TonB [Pyrinomonadaceae bacterium]